MTSILSLSTRNGRWLLPGAALVVAVAALASAWLFHRWCTTARQAESTLQKTTLWAIDEVMHAKAPPCATELVYVRSLPAAVSLDKLVQSLQDSAKTFGVTVLSVSGEPHPGNERTLETLVVSIALHGGYAGIKSALAESLSRFPTQALQELRIKRSGAATLAMEDANVQLVFALRPSVAAPVDCQMPATDHYGEVER